MLDPRQIAAIAAHNDDAHAPARLGHDISPEMRQALIALLAGPAEFLPGSPHRQKWQAPGAGRLQRIGDATMRALADRGLVNISPHRRIGYGRSARLSPRGLWCAHQAAREAADHLLAALGSRSRQNG